MADQRTTATKPSRSDDVLDEVQQFAITEQVKEQFDSLAPKRPLKPSRSDPDPPTHPIPFLSDQHSSPELYKFRSLQSQGQFVVKGSHADNISVREDFTETRYYEQMQSVDKEHHTTGNGFIKVATDEVENGGRYYGNINLDVVGANGELVAAAAVRSNPATNDWVPTLPNHDQVYVSSKPKRSESD